MLRMFGAPKSPQEEAAAAAAAEERAAADVQAVDEGDILVTDETAARADSPDATAAPEDTSSPELSDPFGRPPASPAAVLAAMAGAGVPLAGLQVGGGGAGPAA